MRFLPLFRLFLGSCLLAALAARGDAQNRKVLMLAGQSNIANILLTPPVADAPCENLSTRLANVLYRRFDPVNGLTTFLPGRTQALFELGQELGARFPSSNVEILMIAQSGSARLWSNFLNLFPVYPTVNLAWIDEPWWGNPLTWTNLLAPQLAALGLTGPDELHLVWGQGESDAMGKAVTAPSNYTRHEQLAFAGLAWAAGRTQYSVHLVTIGSLDSPQDFKDQSVDHVRDAYNVIVANPLALIGPTPTIDIAAHHEDVEHADVLHLSTCGYFELARRIADGVASPGLQPRVTGSFALSPVAGGTDVTIPTNMTLAARTLGSAGQEYFPVEVGGLPLTAAQFQVGAPGGLLRPRILGVPVTANNLSIRYVAGRGIASWALAPAIEGALPSRVLAPFLLPKMPVPDVRRDGPGALAARRDRRGSPRGPKRLVPARCACTALAMRRPARLPSCSRSWATRGRRPGRGWSLRACSGARP